MKQFFIAVSLRIAALLLAFFILFAFSNVLKLPAFGSPNTAPALAAQPVSLLNGNRFLTLSEQSRLALEQLVSTGADETSRQLARDVLEQINELCKQFAAQPLDENTAWIPQYLNTCADIFSLLLAPGEWSGRTLCAQKLAAYCSTLQNYAQDAAFEPVFKQYSQSLPLFDNRTLLLQAYLSALLRHMQQQEAQSHIVSLSFGGNVSLQSGQDTRTSSAFEEEFLRQDTSLSFALGGFAPVLKNDGFSLINLQNAYTSNPTLQAPTTRAMPDFVQMLLLGGVESANVNSYSLRNCPKNALTDTKSQLNLYGIVGVEATPTLKEIGGICFGFMAFLADGNTPEQLKEQAFQGLQALKSQGAQACILLFDWGNAQDASGVSRYCIDAGADMVVGFGTQAQGVQTYKGKPIVQSLGVCYPGDGSSYQDTPFLFRQSFALDASGQVQPVTGIRFDLAPSQESTPCWDFGLDVQILFE